MASACADRNAICSLEMGGKNAIIVMDDADVDNAVEGAIWGAFGTSGQRCTASSRLIVHKKVYKQFSNKLVERAKALRIGNGADPKVDVGPVINQDAVEKITNYIDVGRYEDGATLAFGGRRLTKGDYGHGYFIEPTVFTDVAPDMRIAQEEIFGPVTAVIPARSLDEAIEIANGVQYGLSAAIYTQDVNRAFHAMNEMYTGIFYVNSSTIGAEVHLPFGGTKGTGNGHREAGTQVLDIFSEWKSVYVDYSGTLQRAQIDNVGIMRRDFWIQSHFSLAAFNRGLRSVRSQSRVRAASRRSQPFPNLHRHPIRPNPRSLLLPRWLMASEFTRRRKSDEKAANPQEAATALTRARPGVT